MLVLSRKPDESIVFPHLGITVRILRASTNKVRIGVDAHPGIHVLRGELVESAAGLPNPLAADPLRSQLADAATTLQQLHQLREAREWDEMEPAILALFRQLQAIDQEMARRTGAADARPPNRRALLVDDNKNETRLLASYLKLKEFDVETADNGADAVAYLARQPLPDVMVLDMNVPRFDGRWTVDEVRGDQRFDGLMIYAVSGIHPAEYGVEVGRQGVNRWFRKPLNPEELVREITQQVSPDLIPAA